MASIKTYLTIKQQHTVAVWLIENGYVTQDKNTDTMDFTYWRIKQITALKEINEAKIVGLPEEIKPSNLTTSLKSFNEINRCFGYKINLPAIQDTVEMDMLTAKVKNLQGQLDQVNKTVIGLLEVNKHATKYLDALRKISKEIPAEIFAKR